MFTFCNHLMNSITPFLSCPTSSSLHHLHSTPSSHALNSLNIIYPTPLNPSLRERRNPRFLIDWGAELLLLLLTSPHPTRQWSMMACSGHKPSYQRLEKLPPETEEDGISGGSKETAVVFKRRRQAWLRLNKSGRWRRPRVRVAGLRKFLSKAAVMGAAVRVSVAKVLKRLKEGRPYLGELFAGNYMFMQVSPSPTIPYAEKPVSVAKHRYRHGPPPSPTTTVTFDAPNVASS